MSLHELTDDQREIRYLARRFAEEKIVPNAAQWDREHHFPVELFSELGELGLMGVCVPEEHGGAGADFLAYMLVLEELSRADAGVGVTVAVHTSAGTLPILNHGSDEQIERLVPPLAAGEELAAFALTESGSGSDASAMRTRVEHDRISGTKQWITNGSFASTFGLDYSPTHRVVFLFYLILALALLTNLVTLRLRRLPIGRAWEEMREDEIACRSLGINTTTTKLTAFAIGAMFGGFAGSFFATRQGFISPESFTFMESAVVLSIVVLGGMGSQIGVAIAAFAMIGGTEILRELDWLKRVFGPDFEPTQYRMLLFGLAMVLLMIWKPRGLISFRAPSIFLRERRLVRADMVKEGHG